MTSPAPAFQECTGSCHENVHAPKAVSSNLQSTDGLTHMSGRNIWIFFKAPQQYIRHIIPWKKCSNLMQFLKYLAELFLRSLRSPRSNDLEIKNDENFLMKTYENYMKSKIWTQRPRK